MEKLCSAIMVTVILILFVGNVQASVCPSTNVIEDPARFVWDNNNEGTLEFGEASFVIGGETLTTRAYRQKDGAYSIPGPTMYMSPGQNYVLTLKNTLPFEEKSQDHNVLKDPNITNIHTHGLHISGETPGDDVTRLFEGGYCGDYVYEMGSDHMGGTNWYHPHHHGSTWLQVAGGAFGMLIVDDSQDGIPAGVAGMTERLLAVGFLEPGRVAGNGGDDLISGTLDSTWTANGLVEGNLCMPENEWQHWRVLIADPDARMKNVEFGPECEVMLLARDGVWRTEAPLALPENAIELTGASRADLAVRCSADSVLTVDRNVVANIYADSELPADLVVGPYSDGAEGGTWSADRPSYLQDLRSETTGIIPDYTDSISVGAQQVYGKAYDEETPIFDLLPGVQEWSISATNHPFHLHIYHQQVQGVCDSGAFEDGEYYDTISGSCDIRFDTDPVTTTAYDGKTIMHCHILEHEDKGAMGWADAKPDPNGPLLIPPPTLPPGKQDYYECGGGDCTPTGPEGPDATCFDGIDNDCDNAIDSADPDCQQPVVCSDYSSKDECNNDSDCDWQGGKNKGMCVDATVCIPTAEDEVGLCADGIDNDCDGVIDCADADDCGTDPVCQQPVVCSDVQKKNECNNSVGCMWDQSTRTCSDVP